MTRPWPALAFLVLLGAALSPLADTDPEFQPIHIAGIVIAAGILLMEVVHALRR